MIAWVSPLSPPYSPRLLRPRFLLPHTSSIDDARSCLLILTMWSKGALKCAIQYAKDAPRLSWPQPNTGTYDQPSYIPAMLLAVFVSLVPLLLEGHVLLLNVLFYLVRQHRDCDLNACDKQRTQPIRTSKEFPTCVTTFGRRGWYTRASGAVD